MTEFVGCEVTYIISGYYLACMFSQIGVALIIVRHLKWPQNPYVKWLQQVTGVGR